MGILNRDEIERRLERRGLLRYARRKNDGRFDIEAASYDLTAGKAVWRELTRRGEKGSVQTRSYKPNQPLGDRPTVTIQPGQMIFVITHEDVCMPRPISPGLYTQGTLSRKQA
jgi:deoxycytidine triphosphate deaminase